MKSAVSLAQSSFNSMDPGGGSGQRRSRVLNIHHEVPAVKRIAFSVRIGCVPDRADVHFLISLGHFVWKAALLFDVGLDDLSRRTGCQVAVLSFFEQRTNDDLRIAARFNAREPSIVFESGFSSRTQLCFHGIADRLCAACLAREVDALQVSTICSSQRRYNV